MYNVKQHNKEGIENDRNVQEAAETLSVLLEGDKSKTFFNKSLNIY